MKVENVVAILVHVAKVTLLEFSSDPSIVGIPDITHVTDHQSLVTSEEEAYNENTDVFDLIVKYFTICCDVFIILKFDEERKNEKLPHIKEII